MSGEELFTRDEVLGGLPAQRARTSLFLIEGRTVQLVDRARRVMERFSSEAASLERELAFVEAFSTGRRPAGLLSLPIQPTIQDLERYAPHWASLVPENPTVKAVLAQLIAEKYTFTYQAVPAIRQSLGLDEAFVQKAYQRQYKKPLERIYAAEPGLLERLRWRWARFTAWLENLPPFWTAFALTLTETVGVGIMALPIALAEIGPLAGLFFLVLLGLVNLVTIAYMAEAVSRNGNIRYGKAYFGRLVADFLGRDASIILSIALVLINFLALLAYYIGLSTTLDAATNLPAPVWLAALFLVDVNFLRRQTLNAAVSAALLVGAVNLVVILVLSLLAVPWIKLENISYLNLPFLGGRPFEPAILQLVFGVILTAYFGHTSMGNCAKVVLHRDPSGRSLIWGSLLAQLAALLIYSIWLLAVNGALPPERLASISGTAMIPLAETIGPIVHVFGSIFILLGMGMGSVHYSLGFFNLVQEWLPRKREPVIILPRRRGTAIFTRPGPAGGAMRLGLVYLGIEAGKPRFRWDLQTEKQVQRLETTVKERVDLTQPLDHLPQLDRHWKDLAIEILAATPELARVRIHTSLALAYHGEWDALGLEAGSLPDLPADQRALLALLIRRGEASQADLAEGLQQNPGQLQKELDRLVAQGSVRVVETASGRRYRAQLAPKRGRQLPEYIWTALGDDRKPEMGEDRQATGRARILLHLEAALLSDTGRFIAGVLPLAAIFALSEWLVLTGAESFSRPLSFLGVIVVSLLGGGFPALLLVASRKKGEYIPGKVYRFLGHPALTGLVYLFSLGNLFLHGLFIWTNPLERATALLVGGLMVVLPLRLVQQEVFSPRAVLEVRQTGTRNGRTSFNIVSGGEPLPVAILLEYPDGWQEFVAGSGELPRFTRLRSATFALPPGTYRDLKVWTHSINANGDTAALPAILEVSAADRQFRLDLNLSQGQAIVNLGGLGSASRVNTRLRFRDESSDSIDNDPMEMIG